MEVHYKSASLFAVVLMFSRCHWRLAVLSTGLNATETVVVGRQGDFGLPPHLQRVIT